MSITDKVKDQKYTLCWEDAKSGENQWEGTFPTWCVRTVSEAGGGRRWRLGWISGAGCLSVIHII